MKYQGKEMAFPAVTKISFFKVIEVLEEQAKSEDVNISRFATELLIESEKYPELKEGFTDLSILKKRKSIIDRLARTLFPKALLTNEIKGLVPPFDFTPFYLSTRFQNILDNGGEMGGELKFKFAQIDEDLFYIYGAATIMEVFYGYKMGSGAPTTVDIEDKKSKITRSYRLAYNADLTEMVATDKAPKITKQDFKELSNDFYNIDLWKEKFPPNSYIMRGVGIANLMDVTQDRSLASITANLLTKTPESLEEIMYSMRNLFGIPDLDGGFVEYSNNTFISGKHAYDNNMSSIVLGGDEVMPCKENLCDMSYEQMITDKKPLIVADTDRFDSISQSALSQKLKENKKIGSFIMAPLIHEGEFLGFMEFVSPRKYELNGSLISKLDNLLPIFSMAMARFKREEQNMREAIIQQECTTIHSSVKWRFDEEANKYIIAQYNKEQPVFQDIVFNKVYPLYGQLDIKGSSEKRNEGIKGDLLKQIKGIRRVLVAAFKLKGMPVYEELMFRLDVFRDEISGGMTSGGEQTMQSFVNREIRPVFDQLRKEGDLVSQIDKYRATLDPQLGTVYELRKKFDTSVNVINKTLASLLDKKQIEAQEMFPHYFERYKTDGVEYNMYIGQSISGSKEFDPVFLSNLRLWQLITNCELENRFEELKSEIETPLEIASLILVYGNPLAVHFRMDEKRFDVEGAYNARYEIVKKRVDKSHIKGTKERITQPGKIAIIYTNEQDADEYRKYIAYLEAKEYLVKGSLEKLELEDLQGITGLKALRVGVNYKATRDEADFSVDKLLADINGN
jgi:hypothetical protein